MSEISIQTKICNKCNLELPIDKFYFINIEKQTRRNECKKCQYNQTSLSEKLIKNKEYYYEIRDKVINGYGAKCIWCGENDKDCMELDHVNNDGYKLRGTGFLGRGLFLWVLKNSFPSNLQLLCSNCNCLKRKNGGTLPEYRKDRYITNIINNGTINFPYKRYRSKYEKERRERNKNKVLDRYGRVCLCCQESDINVLEVDHKDNTGYIHRKQLKTGKCILDYLIRNNFPEEFQILCSNCNKIKFKNNNDLPEWRKDKYKILKEIV